MIAALLMGAVTGVDRTAFGQTLLSSPVIAGTLAGWWAGDAFSGLIAGIFFAAMQSASLPLGGARRPVDWTSVAVALPLATAGHGPHAWGLGLVLSIPLAHLSGLTISLLRRQTGSWWRGAGRGASLRAIEGVHLGFTVAHALRAAGFTLLSYLVLSQAVAIDTWSESELGFLGVFWRLAPVAGLPLLLRAHLAAAHWAWLGLGALVTFVAFAFGVVG